MTMVANANSEGTARLEERDSEQANLAMRKMLEAEGYSPEEI
jgi:hypothetical protein